MSDIGEGRVLSDGSGGRRDRGWYLVMMPFQIDEKHVEEVHEAV
jgi:hypothetical protein